MLNKKDPVHIPSASYTVKDYDGNEEYVLNKALLDIQNAWDNLEQLKEVHAFKLLLYSMIEETNDSRLLKEFAKDIELCEFELQRLWGFTEDAKFHRFWETPKCTCPKMDNRDGYPHILYVNLECPLHKPE